MIFKVNNKKIYASDAGKGIDPKKETVVLLHGSGLSHIVWSLTEQYLSNHSFNVISLDLPGHGNSEDKSKEITLKLWLDKYCSVSDQTI